MCKKDLAARNIEGNMKLLKATFYYLFLFLNSQIVSAQPESFYIKEIQAVLGGKMEVVLSGGRADIVNEQYAIEVEFADHWKNSIGQALWYGLQTNKQPGIAVVMRTVKDRKYGIMLQSAIDYAGLTDKIKVWFYPEDFGKGFSDVQQNMDAHKSNQIARTGHYSRNKNTGVRHNSKCTHFTCGNCVACGPTDGKKACGTCGG